MSQHWSKGDVSDAFDTLDGGVELVVDDDSALVVFLDADRFQVQPFGVGTTANGQQDYVSFQLELNTLETQRASNIF